MQLNQRIHAFIKVGEFINNHYEGGKGRADENLHMALTELTKAAHIYNGWFTEEFTGIAFRNIASMLTRESLETLAKIIPPENKKPKVIALICAGNIPMVCFHDVLCVLLTGNTALIKMSSDDKVLLPFFLKLLTHYEPRFDDRIRLSDGKITGFDAVIATGSNNSADHFKQYFSKYPHIIRRNRSSLAVLTGKESKQELEELGKDIFYYFGLGCRNVSKLLVPKDYKFDQLFEAMFGFAYVMNNNKYANNYEYNRTIYLMGKEDFLDNNFIILKPDNQIHAPISVVYYQRYESEKEIEDYLLDNAKEIQCVVGYDHVPFGNSQCPVITDFADDINTVEFLVYL
jgi:hypothetical protein